MIISNGLVQLSVESVGPQRKSYFSVEEITPPPFRGFADMSPEEALAATRMVDKIAGDSPWSDWRSFSEQEKLSTIAAWRAGYVRIARVTYTPTDERMLVIVANTGD